MANIPFFLLLEAVLFLAAAFSALFYFMPDEVLAPRLAPLFWLGLSLVNFALYFVFRWRVLKLAALNRRDRAEALAKNQRNYWAHWSYAQAEPEVWAKLLKGQGSTERFFLLSAAFLVGVVSFMLTALALEWETWQGTLLPHVGLGLLFGSIFMGLGKLTELGLNSLFSQQQGREVYFEERQIWLNGMELPLNRAGHKLVQVYYVPAVEMLYFEFEVEDRTRSYRTERPMDIKVFYQIYLPHSDKAEEAQALAERYARAYGLLAR